MNMFSHPKIQPDGVADGLVREMTAGVAGVRLIIPLDSYPAAATQAGVAGERANSALRPLVIRLRGWQHFGACI